MCFSPYLGIGRAGGGGGSPKGLAHNLLMQFFTNGGYVAFSPIYACLVLI